MAERAHPDLPGFKRGGFRFVLRRGIVPWLRYTPTPPYRKAFERRYKWANSYCNGKDVLDIPCGMGWGTSLITSAKTRCGMDRDEASVEEARQRYGHVAEFRVGDMANLDVEDGAYDVVVCLEGIEHVPQEVGTAFLHEAWRVLRPTGILLLSTPYMPSGEHSGNPYHIHEYQPDEMRALVDPLYTIEHTDSREVDKLVVQYLVCRKRNDA